MGDHITTAKVQCPYCGFQNLVIVRELHQKSIVTCCVEDGGCDRDFVVSTHIQIECHVRPLMAEMIEAGEEKEARAHEMAIEVAGQAAQ